MLNNTIFKLGLHGISIRKCARTDSITKDDETTIFETTKETFGVES